MSVPGGSEAVVDLWPSEGVGAPTTTYMLWQTDKLGDRAAHNCIIVTRVEDHSLFGQLCHSDARVNGSTACMHYCRIAEHTGGATQPQPIALQKMRVH